MDARIVDGRKIARVTDDGKLEVLVHGRDGDNLVPIKVSEDGYLMLATEGVTVDLDTVELNQGAPGQNPWPVTLSGTKSVTQEVLLDAVSVAPLSQTGHINLNITNEKKVVLLVTNDLDTLQIRSSGPGQNAASVDPLYGSLYPMASGFSTASWYNPHVFVWVGMQFARLGLTDIKEAFDIALPPVSPSFIRVHNNNPDETLTITIRILRYWR
jgi:hypothetical protein